MLCQYLYGLRQLIELILVLSSHMLIMNMAMPLLSLMTMGKNSTRNIIQFLYNIHVEVVERSVLGLFEVW